MKKTITTLAALAAATLAAPLASADQPGPGRDRFERGEPAQRLERDRERRGDRYRNAPLERPGDFDRRAGRRAGRRDRDTRDGDRRVSPRRWQRRLDERESRARESRAERRRHRVERYRSRWQRGFLASSEVREELRLHARRIARLERMKRIAESGGMRRFLARIARAERRENRRHDRAMARLKGRYYIR